MSTSGYLLALAVLAAREIRGDTQYAVVDGEPTAPGEFEEVVQIKAGQLECSGTLIDDSLVVTAAHCFSDVESLVEIEVSLGLVTGTGVPLAASEYAVHPDFCGSPSCAGDESFDVGYLRLAQPQEHSRAMILEQDEWDTGVHADAEVQIVGYGEMGIDGTHTKRSALTEITSVSPLGGAIRLDGATCGGDSGGPVLTTAANGEKLLAAVVSTGSRPCGAWTGAITLYSSLEWLVSEGGFVPSVDCPTFDCVDTHPSSGGGCTLPRREWGAERGLLLLLLRRRRAYVRPLAR